MVHNNALPDSAARPAPPAGPILSPQAWILRLDQPLVTRQTGALAGLRFAIKDNIDAKGLPSQRLRTVNPALAGICAQAYKSRSAPSRQSAFARQSVRSCTDWLPASRLF
ncbi:MAG: hypothetical protein JZU64_05865 [Rhodoferax sp.]|nr:hypothetical protein [Rhodoferax sp.]